MRRFAELVATTGGLLMAAVLAAQQPDIVVAPGGDDQAGKGTAEAPFASLTRAREAVRELRRREPARTTPVAVALRGGTYYLTEPFRLTPDDSGRAASPVIYTAWPGETPVISGGVPLTDWHVKDGRWELHLPAVPAGEWSFCQLFVNGERRWRPRLPRDGYLFIEKELPPTTPGGRFDRFGFRAGDLRADWQNLHDVEVLPFHSWGMSRLRIAAVDTDQRTVTFTGTTCGNSWWAGLQKGHRYLVENVREALDTPGQWYLDRPSGVLTYLPLPGEDPATATVVAPRLERLLDVRGEAALGLCVSDVRFQGLTFAHGNWVLPEQGYSYGQADAGLRGALYVEGGRNIAFLGCRVRQVGTYAIDLAAGSEYCRIENCEVLDIATGGIRIGEGWGAREGAAVAGHNTVRNNTIAHGGRLHPAGIGVWIGLSAYNTVEHNDIFDFYYSGLSVGWTWGYGPTPANHNTIADNHVFQIGQGVLSDMGGIYTLGLSPGTTIRHNCFHDIESFDYGGWGIYFDEGSTGIVAEDNLVYGTKTGGFHQHYGKENIVRNNIFAFARVGQLQRTRDEEHLGFTFEQNIVYWTDGPLLHGNWNSLTGFAINRNLYWNAAGDPIVFAGQTLEQWQAKGRDGDSVIADPGFADPAQRDFTLKADSPAGRIGFKPFPLTGFGRQAASSPAAARAFPRAFPPPPPPPPPTPIDEDFEVLPVGSAWTGATTHEDEQVTTATARVSDEQAAAGKHSLKLTDQPGQKYPWNPHVFCDPAFPGGVAEGRFDARFEGGATFFHEWRDNSSPYRVGPSLRVRPDGTLVSGERELTRLPLHTWIRFEIMWGMTPELAGRFTLKVTVPGAEPQEFADLPCNPRCRTLRWYGFCSEGNDNGAIYLDNVLLTPRP